MDIAAEIKTSEEGAFLHLKDKKGNQAFDDEGRPVTIKLAGTDSKRWRTAEDVVGDKRLKRADRRHGIGAKSMAEQREDRAYLLASITLEWSGIKVDGSMWPCDADHAKRLYLAAPFIADQVDEFVGDKANF